MMKSNVPYEKLITIKNGEDIALRTAADDSPEQLYALWRDAVVRSRALFAVAMTDGGPARWAGVPDSPAPSLRYILLNMIEEYAHHNGHADLLRESIDGRVGNDPPR